MESRSELIQFAVYGQERIAWRVSPRPRRHSGQVLMLMPREVDHADALRWVSESECCNSVKLPPIDRTALHCLIPLILPRDKYRGKCATKQMRMPIDAAGVGVQISWMHFPLSVPGPNFALQSFLQLIASDA